ncbi:galactosyltransferase-like protein [Selaginella moellendorffii]|uniref:Galactosyltransferase-like protein n=1 Tax=Selaginella moellendorffii TaxID=88036 RepID=D8S480_SELML|nr:probable xyloglucan galactosyltransferase GT11 [Selaginella moellendorffii]EFJ20708.1 galactosyltransferase-like protein [Selaginella moellendorffii]|eukprot:XP_002978051.1 probable xyloglucan galactosyltransferase GT11 [Selaginella moellendorffii]
MKKSVATASLYCFLVSGMALLFFRNSSPGTREQTSQELSLGKNSSVDGCKGKRVFVYNLPSEFNSQLLERCNSGIVNWLNFCDHVSNDGFGQPVPQEFEPLLGKGWYKTDSYMLEVIFHRRMASYECLTDDPARANAFYVPYYAGLDALHYLYNPGANKSLHGAGVAEWLERNAARKFWDEEQGGGGRDHFMVMGRTAWDFGAGSNPDLDRWGTPILASPKFSSMSVLFVEKNPWDPRRRQHAVPYPTAFHPGSRGELGDWIARVRGSRRSYLFAFAGAPRPSQEASIRSLLLDQCVGDASARCKFVDCGERRCGHDPAPIAAAFLSADFCLQPRGDSATRRSVFDAIVAGCIPVFFHEDSAYSQYTWHLPDDPRGYSVFVREEEIKGGNVSISEVLGRFPREEVAAMRARLLEMAPRLIYARGGGSDRLEGDAFDVAIQRVLEEAAHGSIARG